MQLFMSIEIFMIHIFSSKENCDNVKKQKERMYISLITY